MKLVNETLSDRVYAEIRRQLVNGGVKPGEVLVIRALADKFGISPTPIRDALQRLAAERLLAMLPNRSFAVPSLSRASLLELSHIRSALESMAGEWATRHAMPSNIAALQALIAKSEKAVTERDSDAYANINQEFHFAIYELAGAPILLRKIDELWVQVGPYFGRLLADETYLPHANALHIEILHALEAGDASRVGLNIRRDIMTATEHLQAHLSDCSPHPSNAG
jgi:DNA-binding GntR family transcriptional regulator